MTLRIRTGRDRRGRVVLMTRITTVTVKRKTDFLKEIIKNMTLRLPLMKKVGNVRLLSEIKWK